jgi:DNA helicase-2/ATP-dependent DNA helicase PcrA
VQTDEFRPGVKLTLKNFIKNYDIWEDDLNKISHVDLAMKILEESGYIQSLKVEKSLESEGRLENLKELVNAMSAFDNMIGFLEHIALVNDSDAEHKDGQISLMTLHAAKGLEFSAVFLPCWEEGSFPSQRSIDEKGKEGLEEERRLAYVGITRAKKHLCISCASSRQIYGNWQNVIPSRFIEELPEKEIIGADFNVINNTSNHFKDYEFNQDYNNNEKFRNIINSGSSYNQINDQNRLNEDYSSNLKIGEKVFHIKFGTGSIIDIDDDKVEVNFDKAGIKKVIGSYLKNKF